MNFKDLLNNIRNAFTSVKLGPSEGQKKIARFVTGSSPTSEYGYQPNILLNAAAQAQRGVNALAEMPRFNFAQQVSQKVSNPYGRFATEFALGIPESILNTPSLYLRGVTGVGQELGKVPRGEANLGRALSRSGELGESILNVLTAGTAGSVTSQLGKQSLKQAMKTGAKTAGKEGVKLGVGYGLATGVRDDNATNQTVGNQLQSGALSALGGGLLGGALGVGTGAAAPIVSSQLRRATAKLPIKNVLEESRKNLSASKKRFKDLLGPRTADSRVGGYIDLGAKVGGEAPTLRKGQPEIGKQWQSDELVARERFDIPNLKKLSSGGSDRDVYDLGDGKVLKIAKTARGLAQNLSEGEPYAPVPKALEKGKNYVVVEKANPPDARTKQLVKDLREAVDFNSRTPAVDAINKVADKYYNSGKPGDEEIAQLIQDFNNYDVMINDLTSLRNWGTDADGMPVHLDAGTLNTKVIDDYKGVKNLDDADFRDVYYQSKTAKKKFGDIDNNTMYGAIAGVEPYQDENGNWKVRYNPVNAAIGVGVMGGLKTKQGKALTEAIGTKLAKSDPLEALKEEARKYKSAEEFVKAQNIENRFNVNDKFIVGLPVEDAKLPKGYKISQQHLDAIGEENIMSINVYDQNEKLVGSIDYGLYRGEPNIKMIEVQKEHRRKGIATAMLDKLQEMYPDKKIEVGMSTPDGTNLLSNYDLGKRRKQLTDLYTQATAPKATTTTKATQQVATKPKPSGMITPKKTLMDVVEELRNKSQIAPKSVTTTQPAQPTQAEITDQSYKYLTTKLPKEVVDDLISSGFTPGQIRTAMVNTPQKTYDKLIKDPRYARNYVNVMMNGKKKPRVELQDDYMESLVQSEQPLKPPAPKVDPIEALKVEAKPVAPVEPIKPQVEQVAQPVTQPVAPETYQNPMINYDWRAKSTSGTSPHRVAMRSNTYEEAAPALTKQLDNFEAHLAEKGMTLEGVAQDLLAGKKTAETNFLREWFESSSRNAEIDGVTIPRNFENYVTQISQEKSNRILTTPQQIKTFGDVLETPFFSKKRTKERTEPLTREILLAHYKESFLNRSKDPYTKAELKLANDFMREVSTKVESSQSSLEKAALNTSLKRVEVENPVQRIQQVARDNGVAPTKTYTNTNKSTFKFIDNGIRSIDDRAARVSDPQFYDDFLYPFKKEQISVMKYLEEIKGSTDEFLKLHLKSYYIPDASIAKMTRNDMIARLLRIKQSEEHALAVNTFKTNIANADFGATIGSDDLVNLTNDIFNEYVTGNIVKKNLTDKVLAEIRSMSGRGALGFNIASAINNIFELRRPFSAISRKSAMKGLARIKNGETFTTKYGISSKEATALERTQGQSAIRQVINKLDDALFYLFDGSESLKDNVFLAGFEEQGIAKGLRGEALTKYVVKKFSQYAVKYGKGQDIGLYRSNLMKTLLQFGQYAIKDAVIFGDNASAAIKGDVGSQKYVAKYVATTIAQAMLFKVVLGTIGFGGQSSSPLDLATNVLNGELPLSPSVQALIGFGSILQDELSDNQMSEYDREQLNKSTTRSLATATIPASNQLYFKTGQSAMNLNRGYQEQFAEEGKVPDVANPVSYNPFDITKSLLFGQSYDPYRQQYTKDYLAGKPVGLDKNQSVIFKDILAEDRKGANKYYEGAVAKNQNTAQYKESLANAVSGKQVPSSLKDKVTGMFSAKATTPPFERTMDSFTSTEELRDYKKATLEALESGIAVPENALSIAFFDGKSLQTMKPGDKAKIFASLNKAMDNEFYSDEQKQAILKASGISEQDAGYYQISKLQEPERRQLLTSIFDSTDRDTAITTIVSMKRKLGNSAAISNTDIDFLYDIGAISKKEKELMNAVKYDEASEKFYIDRDYKAKTSGGSSKDSPGRTRTNIKTIIDKVNKLFEQKPIEEPKRKITDLFPQTPKLTTSTQKQPIRKVARMKSRPKNYWFTPY